MILNQDYYTKRVERLWFWIYQFHGNGI